MLFSACYLTRFIAYLKLRSTGLLQLCTLEALQASTQSM